MIDPFLIGDLVGRYWLWPWMSDNNRHHAAALVVHDIAVWLRHLDDFAPRVYDLSLIDDELVCAEASSSASAWSGNAAPRMTIASRNLRMLPPFDLPEQNNSIHMQKCKKPPGTSPDG